MNISFRTIALTGNFRVPGAAETVSSLAGILAGHGAQVVVSDRIGPEHGQGGLDLRPDDALVEDAELLIAVGGDGSMLYGARQAAAADIPLLGINRGRLGFLADVGPDDMEKCIGQVLAGDYESEMRMLLNARIAGTGDTSECGCALNDIVVKRQDTGRMLEFRTYVDGHYVNTHGGDGFIVASPTGSTAYALSCGGPIVSPEMDAIVLAPICPHTLSDRPIVIPGDSVTEIRLREDDGDKAEVSCDGEVRGWLEGGNRLLVEAARRKLQLIHPTGYDFFAILRGKLNWGRRNRRDAPA